MFKKIPAENMRWLLICLAGFIVFIAATIYPTGGSLRQLDEKIGTLKHQVESQKSLLPLYAEMRTLLESNPGPTLTVPEPGKYPRDRVDQVSSTFDELIRETGLSLVSVMPDLYAFAKDPSLLPLRMVVRGSFFDFRHLLMRLGNVPAIAWIEEIGVRQIPGSREFDAKLVLAVGE